MTIPRIPDDFDKWNQYTEEHDGPGRAVRLAPWLVGGFILACLILLAIVVFDG